MFLVLDTETTITPPEGWSPGQSLLKGGDSSPYLSTNELVCVQVTEVGSGKYNTYFDGLLFTHTVQEWLDKTTLLIGFNLKFDLAWLRECGFKYNGEIWDCQLVEYVLSGCRHTMPSLNEVAQAYGIPLKKDTVKELWQAGVNTDEIDRDILKEYGEQDVAITEAIFKKQYERKEFVPF